MLQTVLISDMPILLLELKLKQSNVEGFLTVPEELAKQRLQSFLILSLLDQLHLFLEYKNNFNIVTL